MASSTAQYAAGDMSPCLLGEESRKFSGKKRRTVYSSAARPLFAAEADFRAGKRFTRVKQGLLTLYGTDLHVVDVLSLEAADAAAGATDVTSHLLRWVNYKDLLDISLIGPTTLKVEHSNTSDKPKVRAPGEVYTAPADDDATSAQPNSSSAVTAAAATASSSSTSLRVTSDYFSLTFRDASVAQQAAAALVFHQAQFAGMQHWLNLGLHAGFQCDLVSVTALPLMFDDSQHHGSSSSTSGLRCLTRTHSTLPPHVLYSCSSECFQAHASNTDLEPVASLSTGGAAAAAAAQTTGSAAAHAAAAYPWAEPHMLDWGTCVPLPAGWSPCLDDALGSTRAATAGSDEPAVLDDLTCPVELHCGPKALQVTFSTPLGAAVATITPQLARAALLHDACRDVLALPLRPNNRSSNTSSESPPMTSFSWSVQSSMSVVGRDSSLGADGHAPSSDGGSGGGGDTEDGSSAGAASSSTGTLPVGQTTDVFAAVIIQVVRSPSTTNTYSIGRASKLCEPALHKPAATAAAAAAAAEGSAVRVLPAGGTLGPTSTKHLQRGSNTLLTLQLGLLTLLAGIALQQSSSQLVLLMFQVLLLGGIAWAALAGSKASGCLPGPPLPSAPPAATASSTATAAGVSSSSCGISKTIKEDTTCGGWSVVLVSADLCSTPSRHLQLQVSLARASRGMARLRVRLASMSAGGAAVPLLGAPSLGDEPPVPVLVSDPEPAWLNKDIKQRFINAKATIEASREQALRTHKWRQQMNVDSVFTRPCPKFSVMCSLLPTYLLSDNSPDGHAVVLMKVGGVKDLCDAIFQTPEGSPMGLTMAEAEHTLALLNEYLVHVAAPRPLPAGFQVQIYDLSGFKLSYVMGDMFTLFKMLVRFGLYYPERLRLALVINTPAWFSAPWRAMSAFLDENTSSKVVVVGAPKAALPALTHHLGGLEHVPVSWGGACTLPFDEYPAHKRMMDFGRSLNAGEQPFARLRSK